MGAVATLAPYNATANGQIYYDGRMTAGSPFLETDENEFEETVENTVIGVWGAGADGDVLPATVSAYVDARTVILSTNALTSVTNAPFAFGTPDTNQLEDAIGDIDSEDADMGILPMPRGVYIINDNLQLRSRIVFQGAGRGRTVLINVTPTNIFRDETGIGNLSQMAFRDATMINLGGSWTGNHQLIRMTSGNVNTDINIERMEFVSDVRAVNLEHIQRAWFLDNYLRPLTNGSCSIGFSQPESTNGTPSLSKQIYIQRNIFAAMCVGRDNAFLDPNDDSTPENNSIHDYAIVNLRANDVDCSKNKLLGVPTYGLYAEGIENEDVTFDDNRVVASPGFPGPYAPDSMIAIWSKLKRGTTITNNRVYGTDTTRDDPNGKGSYGIRVSVGDSSVSPIRTGSDQTVIFGNDVRDFEKNYQTGDTSVNTLAGNVNFSNNSSRDAGESHALFLFNTLDATNGVVVNLDNNTWDMSTPTSNVKVQLALGAGVTMNVRDQTFNNSNHGFEITAASVGKIVSRGNKNNTNTKVWGASDLLGYDGEFVAEDARKVGPSPDIDLSQAGPFTVEVGAIPFPISAIVKLRVTYTEATDGTAGRTIAIKSNNSTTLVTYTTLQSKALYFKDEVSFTYAGWAAAEINTSHGVLTATCNGGGGAGMVKVECEVMPN